MSADQISEIRPAIREVQSGGPDLCATFEVVGAKDKWVQFTKGTINAAYPYKEHPQLLIEPFAETESQYALTITSWESGKFVTLDFPQGEPTSISKLIDFYFMGVLKCDSDYSVDVTIEEI